MTRRLIIPGLAISVALGVWLAAALRAQNARGTILGHIQDPSGAAVPTAKVTLRNVHTNVTSTFPTTSAGDYQFVSLIPGTYEVTVAAQGFKSAVSKDLVLQVDQTLRQDFALTVGEVAQQVTVSAQGQMVQADNPTIGQVISSQVMEALPISGRDFTNLLQINAGVTTAAGGIQNSIFDTHGLNSEYSMVSVDGARPGSISYILDGFTDTDFFFSKAISIPPADAIQEFKLQNGLYSAEYGFGSAQVNAALKSGTNQLHGMAYDYVENAALQPVNPVFSFLKKINPKSTFPIKPAFNQNMFGGQAGGPLVLPHLYNGRNKSFWFLSYVGGRNHSLGGLQQLQVPSAQERTGDFSDWPYPIYNPATTGTLPSTPADPSGRLPFAGNKIPSSMFNSIGQKLMSFYPTPNFSCTMPCTNLLGNTRQVTTTDNLTGRFDENLSSRDELTFTASGARDLQPGQILSIIPASSQNATNYSYLFGLRYQRSFSPSTVASFRLGYTRENFHEGAVTAFGPNLSAGLGLQNVPNIPAYYGLPLTSVGDRYSGLGTNNNGYSEIDNLFSYGGDVIKIHGRHTLHLGADVRRVQLWDEDGFVVNGSLSFTGAYTAADPLAGATGVAGLMSGNGFADMLMGNPLSAGAPAPLGSDLFFLRGTEWGFYGQDDFHVTPRLTLNLGLRYEIPAAFHSITNSGSVINLKTPGGSLLWADRGFVQNYANPSVAGTYFQCCADNKLFPNQGNKLFPRVGFAWRPFSTPRFVVRGGFGMYNGIYMRFYDGTNYDENSLFVTQANPNYPVASGSETVSPLSLSGLWLPPQIINPFTSFPLPWQFGIQTQWPQNQNPYDEQWSLDTQYELRSNLLLDVGYVGARGLHLPTQYFFNTGTLPSTPDIINGPTGSPVVCNKLIDASQAVGSFAGCPATGSAFQPVDTRVPFKNFAPGSYANANLLDSYYNALQVRLTKRFSQGLSLLANYTWSRSLDENSEIASFSNGFTDGNENMNNHNLRGDWGPADFDQTNRLVVSYVYELPVGKGRHWSLGPADWVLGGWQSSGVVTFASGFPFGVFCCWPRSHQVDLSGDPFGARIRANVNGPLYPAKQTVTQWFNTSSFTVPAYGTYGNSGRNILRGPMLRQGDLSFLKSLPITERNQIQLRLDIFNVFSSWHNGKFFPLHDVEYPYFGSFIATKAATTPLGFTNLWTPRVLQLSLRYSF